MKHSPCHGTPGSMADVTFQEHDELPVIIPKLFQASSFLNSKVLTRASHALYGDDITSMLRLPCLSVSKTLSLTDRLIYVTRYHKVRYRLIAKLCRE